MRTPILTTRDDLLRRRYNAITGSMRFAVKYEPQRAYPYIAYVDQRKILYAPTLASALELAVRYVLAHASHNRASGSASLVTYRQTRRRSAAGRDAHRSGIDRSMNYTTVNNKRRSREIAARLNALKAADAMTILDRQAETLLKTYSRLFGFGIDTP